MKVSGEHFKILADNITGAMGTSERERWDALWRAVDAGRISYRETLWEYNDAHVDTALRKIQRERQS